MKKSIITLALALLMVASVFAAEVAKSSTDVVLTLEKEPTYKVAVTSAALDATTTKNTTLTNTDTISLSYDKSTLKFAQPTTSTYYVSYIFYEYADVTLSMAMDGPLTRYEGSTKYTTDDDKIDYQVEVAKANDNKGVEVSTFTLNSQSALSNENVVTYEKTTKMGDIRFASLQLTVKPISADQTVEGKNEGSYKSTITLTATTK